MKKKSFFQIGIILLELPTKAARWSSVAIFAIAHSTEPSMTITIDGRNFSLSALETLYLDRIEPEKAIVFAMDELKE